ncbi:hypothetical protein ACIBF1_21250 [Spirillospora sp. NPDC050679]
MAILLVVTVDRPGGRIVPAGNRSRGPAVALGSPLLSGESMPTHVRGSRPPSPEQRSRERLRVLVRTVSLLVVVGVAGVAVWLWLRPAPESVESPAPAQVESVAPADESGDSGESDVPDGLAPSNGYRLPGKR